MAFWGGYVERSMYITPPHTLHFILTRSIWITQIQTDICLYAFCAQNINSYELVLETSHCHTVLISQHHNFMLVNLVYFRISVF